MRRSPPANCATPSVCARGLHMPPPAKARVSSRSGKRCQENEVDVGQDVQGLGGAARRRRRPVGRLPATRAARRAKTPAKKTRKSVSKRRSIRHSRTPRGRCSARRSTQRGVVAEVVKVGASRTTRRCGATVKDRRAALPGARSCASQDDGEACARQLPGPATSPTAGGPRP